eukprot:14044918-Ditylum_brightwellii.AAC.1
MVHLKFFPVVLASWGPPERSRYFGLLQIPQKYWLKRNLLIYSHSEDYVSDEVYTDLSVRICEEFVQGHEGVASGDRYLWEFSLDKVLAMDVPNRQSWLHSVSLACNG